MTNEQIRRLGGTPRGPFNAAPYGPLGKGTIHISIDILGGIIIKYWQEMIQVSFQDKLAIHGLYSVPGSVTSYGEGSPYDFSFKPIDIADAIAKQHDIEYEEFAGDGYRGFLEDERTLGADIAMIRRVDQALGGMLIPFKKMNVEGVEEPQWKGFSFETLFALIGQRAMIGALATYKEWKMEFTRKEGLDIDRLDFPKVRGYFMRDHPISGFLVDKIYNSTPKGNGDEDM